MFQKLAFSLATSLASGWGESLAAGECALLQPSQSWLWHCLGLDPSPCHLTHQQPSSQRARPRYRSRLDHLLLCDLKQWQPFLGPSSLLSHRNVTLPFSEGVVKKKLR